MKQIVAAALKGVPYMISQPGYGRRRWLGLVTTIALAAGAHATTVNIDTTFTNAGSCQTNPCAENYLVTVLSGATQVVNVPPTGSFAFSNSFNGSGGVPTGSILGASATGSGGPWNFQDNILFNTNGALVQAQAIASLTSVSDLQIRVISLTNPATHNPWDITNAPSIPALLGGSGVVTILNGWTNFVYNPLNLDYAATMANTIAPGSYILQIRGDAAAGSTYSGNINFTAVPLPAGLWLLLSGTGLLGGWMRRRAA